MKIVYAVLVVVGWTFATAFLFMFLQNQGVVGSQQVLSGNLMPLTWVAGIVVGLALVFRKPGATPSSGKKRQP